ncbi:ATP-binding cassette domain-containing protein [Shigella flexneri]
MALSCLRRGKSTLIRCVNLLERPTEGSVLVDGRELTTLSESESTKARRQIVMIFQHFNLLSSRTCFWQRGSAAGTGQHPKDQIKRRVTEWLSLVGLAISMTATRRIFPVGRNNVWRLPVHEPAIPKYCRVMKPRAR